MAERGEGNGGCNRSDGLLPGTRNGGCNRSDGLPPVPRMLVSKVLQRYFQVSRSVGLEDLY